MNRAHNNSNHERGSRHLAGRILALFLALAMVVSLGVDIDTMQVYATESESSYISEDSTDDEIHGTTYTESKTDADEAATEESGDASDTEVTYTCGQEEHTHTDDCYQVEETRTLICGQEETADTEETVEGHHHTDSCYTEEQVLTCGQDERAGHSHSEDCYDENGALICGQDESEGHTHTDACYTTERKLTCGQEESEDQTVTEAGHTHTDDCYEITRTQTDTLICGKEEHTHTDACKTTTKTGIVKKAFSKIKKLTSSDAVNVVSEDGIDTQDNSSGVNMNGYITNVSFEKKNGKIWESATSFTTDDQVKGTISFANMETSTIKANGNKIYIDLPEYINCKDFVGQTYNAYDGGTQSGTYTFEKDSDGNYRIVLTLLDNYVNNAGSTIGGSLEFQFEWDENKVPSGGLDKVEIGNWDGEIEIKNTKKTEEEKTENNYSLSKKASDLRYSEDGKTVYIDYTLTLKVKKDVTGSITMKDALTATGFIFDGDSIKVSGDGVTVDFNNNQTTSTDIQVWPTSNNTIKAGTYTITYTVKSNVDVSDKNVTISDSVKNEVTLVDKNDTHKKDTTTSTTTGTIDKSGKLISGSDATYIDYTVYLNAGDIVKNLTTGANFTDTLPNILELQGDVTVKQYDVTGKLVNTTTATVDGQNISYTTPTGQYYYEITYRTKVKGSDVPIGGTTVENKGHSEGGVKGDSSSKITIPNDVLDKNYVSKTEPAKNADGKWVIETIKWTSKIDVEGSLEGYVYEDWGELKSTQAGVWFAPLYMTDDQFNAIVVKDANGNVVDSSKYTLEKSTHKENKWTGQLSEDINNGLFKITFSKDVTGPVTIEYETAADMTNFDLNSNFALVNWGSLSKDGHTDTDSAQTTTINYQHENRNLVRKYGGASDSSNTSGKTDITLEPGQKSIPWTISVNEGRTITSDVTVTDTIADGMTLDKSTVKIVINGWNDVTNNTIYCIWSYDESSKKLTVHVKYDAFKADSSTGIASYPFTISYSTILPDSFFEGSETTKEFSNTASVSVDGSSSDSTFTEKVTRQVVGKSGSYDETTKTLSYNVVINPDGSTLNKGNSLKVEDTLKLKDSSSDKDNFMQYVHLSSLKLFTALKTTDSSGNVTIAPGTYVRDLNKVDSGTEDFTYTYSEDTDSKGVTSDTFTTYLPDSTAYVIVAEYTIDVDVSEDVAFTNRVKLTGSDSWEKKDEATKATSSTSGSTYTNKDILTVTKHDAAAFNTTLKGAVFSLQKYESSAWTNVASLTTGENGKVTQTDILYNTLYKLNETKAPDGYTIDNSVNYFIVVRESDAATAKNNLPDCIADESSYSKDAVQVFTVKDNAGDNKYYANVQIDRYDKQDTSKIEPGQLRVNKVWVDASGKTVTDAVKLVEMEDVSVTLTKHVAKTGHTVTIKAQDSQYTQTITVSNVNDGAYLVTTVEQYNNQPKQDSYSCTDTNVKMSSEGPSNGVYTYKVGPITKDCTIVEGTLAYCTFTQEGGTAPEGTIDTVISTVTLNSANDWTYLWTNLDRSSGVTYSITEQSVSGYNVSYKINGTDLEAGTTFTPSEAGDKVTITNTANPEYELPETGGSGTLPYTFGGLAFILFSLLSGWQLRRRSIVR